MSENNTSSIISKVWGMCSALRDDGVSYGDYLEQLTYLIFLKMSDEYSKPPYNRDAGIPEGYAWSDMNTLKGAELETKYKEILEKLGDVEKAYVRVNQNKAYWVKGDKTGDIDMLSIIKAYIKQKYNKPGNVPRRL